MLVRNLICKGEGEAFWAVGYSEGINWDNVDVGNTLDKAFSSEGVN